MLSRPEAEGDGLAALGQGAGGFVTVTGFLVLCHIHAVSPI
jgi:hypothetical protein